MDFFSAYEKGLEKVKYLNDNLNGEFPHITQNGQWLTNTEGHWTGGFWTGLLWLNFLNEKKENLKEKEGQEICDQIMKLAVRMNDNKTHDMGFIFGPSCVLGNSIETNESFVEMALAGANNMLDLYEERVGLVLAWDEPNYEGVAIVDTIMNAPLLSWAAQQTGDEKFSDTAMRLADSIQKYHIRPDYSVYHVVRWDTDTFEIAERSTHQGYSADTCWSRGQAWALYGFSNMYRYTGKQEYLETSEKLAEYYWNHIDTNTKLPRWDFTFKDNDTEPIDAAASSIAASGLMLLSKMLKEINPNRAEIWRERSKSILYSMIEHCLYNDLDNYGIIRKATIDKPRNSGVSESAMYGDYYFMEALYRHLNEDNDASVKILY
ncbi:glycoside hydrolase family 88 protein [Oceanobacillus sojae]|uniref:glycoside hydrolase family 88 protein n=1 Tax=Oceanobacillus sojae TaxID=582851 RepID=UPI0009886748|nr:glycoside hydrolase family 88 protein [Oceanobacillus sojae]